MDVLASLTPREHAVMVQLSYGEANAEIASALAISVGTFESHLKAIYRKLGAQPHGSSRYLSAQHHHGLPELL